jgi:hypothetical protein
VQAGLQEVVPEVNLVQDLEAPAALVQEAEGAKGLQDHHEEIEGLITI